MVTNTTIPADATLLHDEELEVLFWRVEQFLALRYEPDTAWSLARSDADLGQARSLARAGCPPELGARILG
jgi:hypothetical protein